MEKNDNYTDLKNLTFDTSKEQINPLYNTSVNDKNYYKAYNSTIDVYSNHNHNNNNNNHNNNNNPYQTVNIQNYLNARNQSVKPCSTKASIRSVSTNATGKFKQVLKGKLQYEWKNIYRVLSLADKDSNGQVSMQDFQHAVH